MKHGKGYGLTGVAITLLLSCTKTSMETPVPCSEKIIEVVTVSTPSDGCYSHSGSINVSANGSSGFTYKINGNPFQSSGNFVNLSPGNYTIIAKDAEGCEAVKLVGVGAGIAGPKFSALKNLLLVKCSRCHSGKLPPAGKDWSIDCTITAGKWLINNRAVIIGDMPKGGPELSADEKAVITSWISAGGLVEN
ncbi:MAG: hypothetical protein H7Y86_17405 [Rhizobacter sp.]|nr:hypothetical protein [Ferruginibacter sp.]